MRALLNSRAGIQKSDSIVYYLSHRVIQMGFFAMIWAISGLVAFIFVPQVCLLFDMTVGSIYTHVSGSSLHESFLFVAQHTGDVSHLCSKEKTLGVEFYVCVHK